MVFDELDRALLRELQNYSWQSDAELAIAVGVTPAVVAERMHALLTQGVIRSCHAEVDLTAIGRPVQALVAVRIRASVNNAMDTFYNWVCEAPEMVNVFVASGGSDFLVHVAVPTTGDLYNFVTERVITQPAVLEARTNLVFEHVHARVIDPFDDEETSRHRRRYVTPDAQQVEQDTVRVSNHQF